MSAAAALCGEHAVQLDLLHSARVAVLMGDVATARRHLATLADEQRRHIGVEETRWLPRLPADARWPARIYLAEHRKLGAMLDALLDSLAAEPEPCGPDRRLDLLDRLAPFRHVLEHHFEREEKGLFVEVAAPD